VLLSAWLSSVAQLEFKERMAELERKHQLEKDTELMALKDAHATTTVQQQHLLEEATPTMAAHGPIR
jgi:hypothetical protein